MLLEEIQHALLRLTHGIGILSRLMPQIQIFFIAMPANIMLGLVLLLFLLASMMTWFLQYFEQSISVFTG